MGVSRVKQMQKIQTKAAELAAEIELLKDEFEEAFDNMPESLQGSERGEKAEERIGILENWHGELEAIAEEDIES